ncbi:hypothetical protein GF340_00990 [Candidatus Peregrinibacteria bacterium]|nr:hypothetical protein [Candidatus Peregrinibacteria bacterium]
MGSRPLSDSSVPEPIRSEPESGEFRMQSEIFKAKERCKVDQSFQSFLNFVNTSVHRVIDDSTCDEGCSERHSSTGKSLRNIVKAKELFDQFDNGENDFDLINAGMALLNKEVLHSLDQAQIIKLMTTIARENSEEVFLAFYKHLMDFLTNYTSDIEDYKSDLPRRIILIRIASKMVGVHYVNKDGDVGMVVNHVKNIGLLSTDDPLIVIRLQEDKSLHAVPLHSVLHNSLSNPRE